MSHDRVGAVVAAAAALGDTGTSLGRACLRAIERDGALSSPMAAWAIETATARFVREAAAACASGRDLEGRAVALLLAASVPTAPLRAVALPLLRGAARLWVRPSRQQREFAQLVVGEMARRGLPVELAPPEAPGAFVADALLHGARTFVAYGSDATLRSIQADLPEGVAFEGRGHGFGVGVVLAEAADDPAAVDSVARDVAHYDQRGCLSPQCVFVEAAGAETFAARLAAALERLERELPRGPLDPATAARVTQWQGALAAAAAVFHRGRAFAVAALAEPVLASSPGARNVAVVPVAGPAHVASVLAPEAAHLTCVGVAGPRARWADLVLSPPAAPRRVAAGAMQDPPLDGPEDPRPPRFVSPGAVAR